MRARTPAASGKRTYCTADSFSRFPAGVENARDALAGDVEPDVAMDAAEPSQVITYPLRLRDLDEKCRRQLRGARQESAVDRQLVADGVEIRDVLHPDHLLRLVPDGGAILEQEADAIPHTHPAGALVLDDAPPDGVALGAVALAAQEIVEPDHFHAQCAVRVRPS
jgi:hypothetical protein